MRRTNVAMAATTLLALLLVACGPMRQPVLHLPEGWSSAEVFGAVTEATDHQSQAAPALGAAQATEGAVSGGLPEPGPADAEGAAPADPGAPAGAAGDRPAPAAEPRPADVPDDRARIDRTAGQNPHIDLVIYYADLWQEGRTLQPVEVRLPHSVSVARLAVEELLRGAPEVGLGSGFPPGTGVQGLTIRDGVLTVDFTPAFAALEPRWEAAAINSLLFTLTQFANIDAVQVWVDGHPAVLPSGTVWTAPRTRPAGDQVDGLSIQPLIPYAGD